MSRPLLYSPTGDVVATADATDGAMRALLTDCFGVFVNRVPVGFPGDQDAFVNWLSNRIFTLVGQEAIENRFGVKISVKPAEGMPS